ncbi:hypothetical protein [Mesorhizobium sp. A623]
MSGIERPLLVLTDPPRDETNGTQSPMPDDGKAAYRAPFEVTGKRYALTEAEWNFKP